MVEEELILKVRYIEIMLGLVVILVFYAVFKEAKDRKDEIQMNATILQDSIIQDNFESRRGSLTEEARS